MCQHNFVYGQEGWITAKGNCDNCGSPQKLDNVFCVYIGDKGTTHWFAISPFGCPGCRKIVDNYNLLCGDIDVTKQFEEMKIVTPKDSRHS